MGVHGTNTAGFTALVRYPCRIRRTRTRIQATWANQLGDRFRYLLPRHPPSA